MARLVRRLPERVVRLFPETVQARQWQPGRQLAGIVEESPASPGMSALLPLPANAVLRTALGNCTVFVDDWIVTEPTGYQYVLSNERFKRLYVAIEGHDGLFAL